MIAFLLALAVASAQAPATPPASRPVCTTEEAVAATVVEIANAPDRYLDRCVTVTGAYAGIHMYSGREGLYLTHRFGPDGNLLNSGRVHRIGIDNQDMRELRMRYPQLTTVTGRVDSCERRSARIVAAGGIPFLGGYCHYEGGPTIVVDRYSITERRFERITGDGARRSFGNLVPMPSDWPARARIDAAAAEFLAALRTRDEARLIALHAITDTRNERDGALLYNLLEDRNSVFAQARGAESEMAIFLLAAEDGTPFGRDDEGASATLCICRTPDCADRWPISINDANNDPARPYACTQIEAGEGGRARLNTPIGGGWTVEPEQTAFRP